MISKPQYYLSHADSHLLKELRDRVYARVKTLSRDRIYWMQAKGLLLPLVYFGLYLLAVFDGRPSLYYLCYWAMGVLMVLIYLNIIHDAAHNNVFGAGQWNKALMYVFDLLGANSYIWKQRHVYSHHHFANVDGWDTDMEQSGILAIYPHVQTNELQKYQHWFCFLIYPTYLFNWLLVRDFRDFFDHNRVVRRVLRSGIPSKEVVKLIFFKSFYFLYQIAIPIFFFGITPGLAFGAWIVQVAFASVFALFVLLPLHPLEDNAYPLPDDDGALPYSWLRHQLLVTNDLTHDNWFVRHVLGSFNFHVAHHIFPNIPHVYYPEITDELRRFAREKGLRYQAFSILEALANHYALIRSNALRRAWYFLEE